MTSTPDGQNTPSPDKSSRSDDVTQDNLQDVKSLSSDTKDATASLLRQSGNETTDRLAPGHVYDAVSLLGFGATTAEVLPEAERGEVVIRYGGWSLQELRDNVVDPEQKDIMRKESWYNKYPWSGEKLPSGIYRLRIPVPDSNRKTFAEQEAMLASGEETAPVVLVATALLVHHLQTGRDLLRGDWTRCKEQDADSNRVALGWLVGRLNVGQYWDVDRNDRVWLWSVRTS